MLRSPIPSLALTAVLLLAPAAPAADLLSITGSVEIGSGVPPVWRAASVGDRLAPGDALRTGPGGRAELSTSAGVLRLFEDSVLRIPRPTRVDLERGTSVFEIPRRSPDDPFEVHTHQAVVMVKGTRFSVGVDDALAAVGVVRGLVSVRQPGQDPASGLLVRPGFRALGGRGQSFELGLMDADSDPWEAWDQDATAPSPPSHAAAPGSRQLRAARAAAHAKIDRMPALAGRSRVPSPAAPTAGTADVDAVSDTALGDQVRGAFAEAQLAGGTGLPTPGGIEIELIGNGNVVKVTAPGVSSAMNQNQLNMVIGGNTAPMGAPLVALLGAQGIDPASFASDLLAILGN